MRCIVCDEANARPGSITCGKRHTNTLRKWQWRSRRRSVVFDGFVAKICLVCEKPLLPDVDNGQVLYHVKCANTARKSAAAGYPYK